MANNKHHHCCCCDDHMETRVEQITLHDGRRAERHISCDENGNEVVEVFAEEKRPLKLEERLVRETEEIVSRETVEHVRDGEVTYREVRSLAPDTPMEVRSRVGLADHHKVVDGDYVKRADIAELVSESVIAGVQAMMEGQQPPQVHVHNTTPEAAPPVVVERPQVARPANEQPLFSAQSQVAQHVEDKGKSDQFINIIMGGIILVQMGFFGYMFFMM